MSHVADTASVPTRRGAGLHRLFWRVHFWAGLITAPIVLFAAFTGLLYVFTPQIEASVHAGVDRVQVGAARVSLDRQIAAAQAAMDGARPRAVVPAFEAAETTQVYFAAPPSPHAGHVMAGEKAGGKAGRADHDHGLPQGRIAYVDPYTARVVGQLAEMDRFKTWARKLHSSALQGNGWRWLIELAASWMLVMFATGLYMWWPRSQAAGGPGWRALLPRWGRGRITWRDFHASLGLAMSAVLMVVLVTGLTWSRHTGENFRAAQEALGQASPKAPKHLRSMPLEGRAPLSAQTVLETALANAPEVQMQLTPPKGEGGVWRVENFDRGQPQKRFALILDAGSGAVLFRSGWQDFPIVPKATAIGIPFHRGEFGVWNQALLAVAALIAIFSVVSGVVMWWRRRPARRVGVPAVSLQQVRAVPVYLWLLCAAMAWSMPVFGISLAVLTGAELSAAAWRRYFSSSTLRSTS
jgi:uncharacterized iron-regulated membrane protein